MVLGPSSGDFRGGLGDLTGAKETKEWNVNGAIKWPSFPHSSLICWLSVRLLIFFGLTFNPIGFLIITLF